MKELSLFLSIDNFAKFDASCQLHVNPRKYQTWFSCCIFRLEQVHQWWSSTTWKWTTTRERSGLAPPSATRSLNAPEWKRWKSQFWEGEIKNWIWFPGVLPCAPARHDRRVLCFSSDRSGRLCRYPIPWGKTGPCFSFFVKMSAFVDVDGGLPMSSTRVGNAICSFDSLAGCC